MSRTILILRHAASSGQATDAPLSAQGMAQAEALIAPLTALQAGPLYASPSARAGQTIAPYAAAASLPVTVLEGLRERTLAPQPVPDWKAHIARSFEDLSYALAGGESFADVRARGFAALAQVGGTRPLVVSHGNWISALFQGAEPFGFADWQALRNPDLFEVTFTGTTLTDFKGKDLP